MSRLADRQLVLVTGKGGVGKTTVAAALARALAAAGRRCLLLEADRRESAHEALEAEPSGGAIVDAGGGVWLQNLDPEAVLDRLVVRRLGSELLARRVIASPLYRSFAAGAPGLGPLALLGNALELVGGEVDGAPELDCVVVDAPAAGHAVGALTAPRLVREAVGSGPVAELAGRVEEWVADPALSAVVVVSLAEEMPVTESLELAAALRAETGRSPDLLVANRLYPPAGAPAPSPAPLWIERRRMQEEQLARLYAAWKGRRLELPLRPLLPAEGLARDLAPRLAGDLDPEASAPGSGPPAPEGRVARSTRPRPTSDRVHPELRRPRAATGSGTTAAPAASSGVGRAGSGAGGRSGAGSRSGSAGPLPTACELLVVVGGGGVGKTTLAAAVAGGHAAGGEDALVMTFDPSLRLKDVLGLAGAGDEEARVATDGPGSLWASLLDARRVFDRIVDLYAPDAAAAERIHANPYYRHLAGRLSGILEYMAVERLYEAALSGRRRRVVLDTPPAQQALDFLDAPRRIVEFLDSGALRLARMPWFDERGRLRPTRRLGSVGRKLESYLDRVVGLDLLRDMVEFFHAFAPLLEGFRERALAVEELLRSDRVAFLLVAPPGQHRVAATMHFARALRERGLTLLGVVVNRVHPSTPVPGARASEGERLMHWLGGVDAAGLAALERLLPPELWRAALPLEPRPPTDLASLAGLSDRLARSWRRG